MYRHRQDASLDAETKNKRLQKYEEREEKCERVLCCFDGEKRQLVAAHDHYSRVCVGRHSFDSIRILPLNSDSEEQQCLIAMAPQKHTKEKQKYQNVRVQGTRAYVR
jgi:hypothetical protein